MGIAEMLGRSIGPMKSMEIKAFMKVYHPEIVLDWKLFVTDEEKYIENSKKAMLLYKQEVG